MGEQLVAAAEKRQEEERAWVAELRERQRAAAAEAARKTAEAEAEAERQRAAEAAAERSRREAALVLGVNLGAHLRDVLGVRRRDDLGEPLVRRVLAVFTERVGLGAAAL